MIEPRFVEFIPEDLEENVLYVSQKYRTAVHKCCCGCGSKVVTPLKPTYWELIVEGDLVSLYPSVGNWSFPCRAHYWIQRNQVFWSYQMSQEEIELGRSSDRHMKERHFYRNEIPSITKSTVEGENSATTEERLSLWQRFKRWLTRWI